MMVIVFHAVRAPNAPVTSRHLIAHSSLLSAVEVFLAYCTMITVGHPGRGGALRMPTRILPHAVAGHVIAPDNRYKYDNM